MPPILLKVTHTEQSGDGDCLAACADMVLQYIGRSVSYKRLIRILKIRKRYGTPFPYIQNLERLGVTVELGKRGTFDTFRAALSEGYPVIAFVETGELPDWSWSTRHALVVVGIDGKNVWVNDPEFADAPLIVPFGDFDLAWFETDEAYAIIRPKRS